MGKSPFSAGWRQEAVEVENVDLGESADFALGLFRGLGGVRQSKSGFDPSTGTSLLRVDPMLTSTSGKGAGCKNQQSFPAERELSENVGAAQRKGSRAFVDFCTLSMRRRVTHFEPRHGATCRMSYS